MSNKGKYLKYGLHIAVVIGLIWAVVKYVNGQEVLQALGSFNYIYLPFMLALTVGFFLLKAVRFVLLMSPFSGNLKNWIIGKGYVSGQAITLLPGGMAARAGLMNQVGIPVAESSAPIAVHSGWDQAVFLLGGLIAALWFPAARTPVLIILGILAVLGFLLLVPATRHGLAGLMERTANRFNFAEQWQQFLDAVPQVFTRKIILGCLILTIVLFVMQIALLWLTVRGLSLDPGLPTLFLAFIVPTMLGRVVPVPGGFGVTEASMVGFLTASAQLDTETTVAAVAIFRIVSIVIPVAIGAFVYFFFWKGEDEVAHASSGTEPGKTKTVAPANHPGSV